MIFTMTAQNKASWAGPSLAIAIAAACAVMASSAEQSDARQGKNAVLAAHAPSQSVEVLMERAISVLSALEASMAKHTKALCQDELPQKLIDGQPFGLIAENLRYAEKQLRDFGIPAGAEAEYKRLVRALAKARSVAAMNDSLVRQWTTIPETFESNIDLEALRALAGHSTRRLGEMVG